MTSGIEHFKQSSVKLEVYSGMCEVVAGHSHPVFLMVFVDGENDEIYVDTVILSFGDEIDHYHEATVEEDQINSLLETGSIDIHSEPSEESEDEHAHKIHFNSTMRKL